MYIQLITILTSISFDDPTMHEEDCVRSLTLERSALTLNVTGQPTKGVPLYRTLSCKKNGQFQLVCQY